MPFFDSVTFLPEDPILGIQATYDADARKQKVNLGIGSYKDADGHPLVFNSVKKAEKQLCKLDLNKEYSPIQGFYEFLEEASKLVFGNGCELFQKGEMFCAQSLGGTGALRLGGEFLAQETSKTIFLSDHNWPNHKLIFTRSGMMIHSYAYYDETRHQINFEGMCKSIQEMSPGSVLLLHASCHNPTGMEPTREQWKILSALIKKQAVVPFFDLAYQGIAEGLDEDAEPVRDFLKEGHEMIVASSYSKNFGLYGERVGLLSVVTHNRETQQRIASQIKQIIRGNYSTPPLHGARIVANILSSKELKDEWQMELKAVRDRIRSMREALVSGLLARGSHRDWSFLRMQKGMFSYSGLDSQQVQRLIRDYAIYMPASGRINVAGLNPRNLDYVIEAILAVVHA